MKTIWILFFASLLGTEAGATKFSKALIYYIPFQVETYEPVTPENIKEKAKYTIESKDRHRISQLLDLMSGGRKCEGFDNKRVRLLVLFEGGKPEIMVDAEGNVSEGKKLHVLSAREFEKLKKLLSELIKDDRK